MIRGNGWRNYNYFTIGNDCLISLVTETGPVSDLWKRKKPEYNYKTHTELKIHPSQGSYTILNIKRAIDGCLPRRTKKRFIFAFFHSHRHMAATVNIATAETIAKNLKILRCFKNRCHAIIHMLFRNIKHRMIFYICGCFFFVFDLITQIQANANDGSFQCQYKMSFQCHRRRCCSQSIGRNGFASILQNWSVQKMWGENEVLAHKK